MHAEISRHEVVLIAPLFLANIICFEVLTADA